MKIWMILGYPYFQELVLVQQHLRCKNTFRRNRDSQNISLIFTYNICENSSNRYNQVGTHPRNVEIESSRLHKVVYPSEMFDGL